MLIELDYETVSALESALIAAEVSKTRDARDWAKMADAQGAPEQRQAAEELVAFFREQADRYHTAMDALQKAKKEGPHA